ncbi:cyclin-dependent kinase 2-interacting protein isoform X2 [Ascaphus truei]|uniref:cyclin-dependent kinase 2-interacting protein isoform X2 n=1 Tax=Ascaphus truei TaxID=8439 RepID=UPI003F590C9B
MDCKSPGFVTPKKQVLSGSARKIKDNAADWHNLMLKWETLNDNAFTVATKIVNLKISTLSNDKMAIDSKSPTTENVTQENRDLETLCSELLCTLENMEKIQLKMEKLSSTLKGVCELESYQYSGGVSKPTLFHTWPTTFFCGNNSSSGQFTCGSFKAALLLRQTNQSSLQVKLRTINLGM